MTGATLSSIGGEVYEVRLQMSECRQAARDGAEYARDRLARGVTGRMPWMLDSYVADGHSPAAALHLSRIFNAAALRVLVEAAVEDGGDADAEAGEQAEQAA